MPVSDLFVFINLQIYKSKIVHCNR